MKKLNPFKFAAMLVAVWLIALAFFLPTRDANAQLIISNQVIGTITNGYTNVTWRITTNWAAASGNLIIITNRVIGTITNGYTNVVIQITTNPVQNVATYIDRGGVVYNTRRGKSAFFGGTPIARPTAPGFLTNGAASLELIQGYNTIVSNLNNLGLQQ